MTSGSVDPFEAETALLVGRSYSVTSEIESYYLHRPFAIARKLDAGSGDAFTGLPLGQRGKEMGPQPDRVVELKHSGKFSKGCGAESIPSRQAAPPHWSAAAAGIAAAFPTQSR